MSNGISEDIKKRLSRLYLAPDAWRLLALAPLWELALADEHASDQEKRIIATSSRRIVSEFPADVDRYSEAIKNDRELRSEALAVLKEILGLIDFASAENFRDDLAADLRDLMPDLQSGLKPYVGTMNGIIAAAGLTRRHLNGIEAIELLKPIGLSVPDSPIQTLEGQRTSHGGTTTPAIPVPGKKTVKGKDFNAAIGEGSPRIPSRILKAIEDTRVLYSPSTEWASGIRELLISAYEVLVSSYNKDRGHLDNAEKLAPQLFPDGPQAIQDQGVVLMPKSALDGELYFVGDVHGDYEALCEAVKLSGIEEHEDRAIIFLGDYGDRGWATFPTLLNALSLKLSYPHRVYLLRGNHETLNPIREQGRVIRWESETPADTEYITAIKEHLLRLGKFRVDGAEKDAFEIIQGIFEAMPTILLLSDGTMALHGLVIPEWGDDRGLPSTEMMEKLTVNKLPDLRKPEVKNQMMRGRLGNSDIVVYTWAQGGRYCGFKDVQAFMAKLGLTRIVRGHDHAYSGYYSPNELPEVVTLCTTRVMGGGANEPVYTPKIACCRNGLLSPIALFQ